MPKRPEQDPGKDISYFARTNFRDSNQRFGIRQADRRSHIYIIGKTGTGKSTLLETLALQDIRAGRGCAVFDPHGDLYESLLSCIPKTEAHRLVDFNLPDDRTLAFNPFAHVEKNRRVLTASSLMMAMKKLWSSYWGPRMEHFLRNALLTLLDLPYATLAEIPRIYLDRDYRNRALRLVSNEHVKSFWRDEYEKIPIRYRSEAISPILNRTGAFLSNPITERLLTKREGCINLREILDSGRILLVNLSKGKLGEDTAYLVGGLLMASLEVAALSRADIPEDDRNDYSAYLDEFHAYTTDSLSSMMSELRKYRVSLILANQFLTQIEADVRDSILGNAGSLISFRLGSRDARVMAMEFYPRFSVDDFVNLPNHHIYLRLMIDGVVSKAFSARTLLH